MDRSRIAIVIAALNEAATIEHVVTEARRVGMPIVVDDGSSDDTGNIARRAGAEVVRHPLSRGYDSALNSGFQRADALDPTMIITMDGDGQHRASLLPQYVAAIAAGADVVAGIRDRKQRPAEWLFAQYTRLRWGLKDPLCGFKAYRMSLYRAVGHFDAYKSIGTELLLTAAFNKLKVVQIEFSPFERADPPRFGHRRWFSANFSMLRAMALSLVRLRRLSLKKTA